LYRGEEWSAQKTRGRLFKRATGWGNEIPVDPICPKRKEEVKRGREGRENSSQAKPPKKEMKTGVLIGQ